MVKQLSLMAETIQECHPMDLPQKDMLLAKACSAARSNLATEECRVLVASAPDVNCW